MKNDLMEQIGKRLRGSREQLKYTREQFAEQVGISPQFLAEIENGKKGMSADTLYRICDRFNFSADYLLFGKITSGEFSSPIINSLKNMPEPYLSLTEEIMLAIEKTAKNKTSKS